jgi:hypothetical protein
VRKSGQGQGEVWVRRWDPSSSTLRPRANIPACFGIVKLRELYLLWTISFETALKSLDYRPSPVAVAFNEPIPAPIATRTPETAGSHRTDLFGTVSIVKEWGRIGQPGTVRHVICTD